MKRRTFELDETFRYCRQVESCTEISVKRENIPSMSESHRHAIFILILWDAFIEGSPAKDAFERVDVVGYYKTQPKK